MKFRNTILILILCIVLCSGIKRSRKRYTRAQIREIKNKLDEQHQKSNDLLKDLSNLNKTSQKESSNKTEPNPQKEAETAAKNLDLQKKLLQNLKETLATIPKNETEIIAELKKSIKALEEEIENIAKKSLAKLQKEATKVVEDKKKVAADAQKTQKKAEKIEKKIKEEKSNDKVLATISKEAENAAKKGFRAREDKKASSSFGISDAIGACTAGLVGVLQGPFCYKKGADFGRIPNDCCCGLERRGLLCFERCRGGYSHFLGVCWSDCPSGYTNIGALCSRTTWKKLFWKIKIPIISLKAKSSYIPKSYTNFASQVVCRPGEYKGLALCYRDCAKINYVNCGIGACSSTKEACAGTIINMVVSVGMAVVNAVTLVLSMGTSSGANAAANKAAAESSKLTVNAVKAANTGVKSFMRYMKTQVSRFLEMIKQKAIEILKSKAQNYFAEVYVKEICSSVLNAALKKVDESDPTTKLIKTFDVLGVYDLVSECKKLKEDNSAAQKTACARAALSTAGAFDPTGILNVAAAFTYSTCIDV